MFSGQQYFCTAVANFPAVDKVQNFAARILSGTEKLQHITPILKELNWLPVHLNVILRESVMTYKCVKSLASSYLCDKSDM